MAPNSLNISQIVWKNNLFIGVWSGGHMHELSCSKRVAFVQEMGPANFAPVSCWSRMWRRLEVICHLTFKRILQTPLSSNKCVWSSIRFTLDLHFSSFPFEHNSSKVMVLSAVLKSIRNVFGFAASDKNLNFFETSLLLFCDPNELWRDSTSFWYITSIFADVRGWSINDEFNFGWCKQLLYSKCKVINCRIYKLVKRDNHTYNIKQARNIGKT